MTTIELDVLLEFRDYLRANYWFLFRRFKLLFLILVIGCVAYPLLVLTGRSSGNPNDNYWGFLIPVGLLVFVMAGTYFGAKRQMASNKALSERIHYTFSEKGIDTSASSSSGHTSWENLYVAHETKTNFLLFISKNMMYTIPKRCFNDADDIVSFKDLLRSQLSSKAKLK
jgi:hypothetical protein